MGDSFVGFTFYDKPGGNMGLPNTQFGPLNGLKGDFSHCPTPMAHSLTANVIIKYATKRGPWKKARNFSTLSLSHEKKWLPLQSERVEFRLIFFIIIYFRLKVRYGSLRNEPYPFSGPTETRTAHASQRMRHMRRSLCKRGFRVTPPRSSPTRRDRY